MEMYIYKKGLIDIIFIYCTYQKTNFVHFWSTVYVNNTS